MQKLLIIIILIIYSLDFCYSQTSLSIDSSTCATISQLDSNISKKFFNIYSLEYKTNLYSRLDSLIYDYAFVKASFCEIDSSFTLIESYYISSDTFPKYSFMDGQLYFPERVFNLYQKKIKGNYTLHSMLKKYSKIKSIQSLSYDKIQIWSHLCVINEGAEKEFRDKRIKELRNTFQILTYVNKIKNKNIVSIQMPSKKPKFKIYGFNISRYL